jgi:hypothetical protein
MNECIVFPMWWTCPSNTKQYGSINPYFRWVNIGCGHGNAKSSMEGKFALMFEIDVNK